jgi:ParB/Sulfiredoxin domain
MKPREIVLISTHRLRPNKRNARTHSKKQIRQIANSILRFGWTYPILADENNEILAGYGRNQAALQLGLREVPVIVLSGLSDAEKRALALADNKIAANAGWDRQLLAEELGELAQLLPESPVLTEFEIVDVRSQPNTRSAAPSISCLWTGAIWASFLRQDRPFILSSRTSSNVWTYVMSSYHLST